MTDGHQEQAWIEMLSDLRAAGTPCVVVTVTGVEGSAPRDAGARMIITHEGLRWGTIGGGNLEHLAIDRSSELLKSGRRASVAVDYPLSERAGQCCGGKVTLFYEAFPWTRPRVVIFGAGHVGQAIGGLAPYMGADVLLIDDRTEAELQPSLKSERPFEVRFIDSPEAEVDDLPAGSHLLVMTHSHALDLQILERALKRGGFAFLGLIGSGRKWARFQARLLQRGWTEEQLDAVTCPIGLGRPSKEPAAIAIAVAAQLLHLMAGEALEEVP